ncbi:helix-turn-helix domain-containing protein [Streptomyces sp. NPDC088354]|uniref:helix-turn-helix domain-containing protein n=1 Tax=Streptomyces sp. NPDC088354 TaxID=3365856 RepID=UPI0037FFB1D4
MISSFHTDILPPSERAEYWTEAVHRAVTRLEIRLHKDSAMSGSLWYSSIGAIHINHVEASPQQVLRTAGIIANDSSDTLIVSLLEAGRSLVSQDGRETQLSPGELILVDSRRPFIGDFSGSFRQSIAAVPLEMLDVPDAYLSRVTGQAYSPENYLGGILASYVGRLASAAEANACLADANRYLERGMVDLLIALVAHEGRLNADVSPTAEETLRLLIREYIRHHLNRPELSPAVIAAAHHISVRYLHKLFEGEDMSVSRWIHHQRLEACREDLSRPDLAGLAVATIAQRWGFASPAHFSRAFRAAYGISPVEWRRLTRDEISGTAWPGSP